MAAGRRPPALGPAALRACLAELQDGWSAGLTVLTGGDLYHLDRAQRALIETLVPQGTQGFALTVFGEQRVDIGTVVAAARSAGMFAERRVVLVRDVEALEGEPDALVAYATDPPRSSHLLVRAPGLDRRRKLHKALVDHGRELSFEAAGIQQAVTLAADVQALAGAKGLDVERQAAVMLAEICAGDFQRIENELEKLRAWTASSATSAVTPELLREVGAGSAALSGWEVASALLRCDRAGALAALCRLLDAGDEPLRLLGGLAYRSRTMLQARALIARGLPPERAASQARIWGERPGAAAAGLPSYDMADVLRFPRLLLEADRTLKSRSLAPRAVLAAMVEQMIPAAPRRAGAPR